MNNIIAYTDNLKGNKWDDFYFDLIEVDTLSKFEELSRFQIRRIFCEAIFKTISNLTSKKTIKLLIVAPDTMSDRIYGIAFLACKEVYTVEVKVTPLFNQWFSSINEKTSIPKVYTFTSNGSSSRSISSFNNKLTDRDTGDFICDQVPDSFIIEKLIKEKSDFLTPFIQLSTNDNVELIEQYFKALVKQNNLNVFEPHNNDAIYAEFENEAGFTFPTVLKSFLILHNGVENTGFMSVQRILKEWRDWQSIYNEWTQEELFDTDNENNIKTLPMYVTPYWVPFFNLGNGNFIALDFAPNSKGTPGQIISFGADEQSATYEAETLSEFLQSFIN